MADDTTLQIEATKKSLKSLEDFAQDSMNNLKSMFSIMSDSASNSFKNLNPRLNELMTSFQGLNTVSDRTAAILGAASTAAIGARNSFNFGNIDTSGLNLFSDQVSSVIEILSNPNTASGAAVEGMKKLSGFLINLGADSNKTNEAMGKGRGALVSFAGEFLKSADNGLKLSNGFLQMSASTGNFRAVIEKAGVNLQNLNSLLAEQQKMLADTATATNIPRAQVESYYSQLGKIPGALNAQVSSTEDASKKINMLQAALQLAEGSGRSYKDVIDDISTAYEKYGLEGEQALIFTSRISELADKSKIPLEIIRKELKTSAESFKDFGMAGESSLRQSEGIANIMNRYVNAIRATGLNAESSASLINNATRAISNLSTTQMAFLSQQSGGPGGLRGAFQIEKMLKEGKTEEVFEMVKKQIQKLMGPMVSFDQATQTEAAGRQFQKQILLLQKGPLGQFAQTREQAISLSEIFKQGDASKFKEATKLSPTSVQDQMKTGSQIRSLSNTPLSSVQNMLENIRYNANIANLSTLQSTLTEGSGKERNNNKSQVDLTSSLYELRNKTISTDKDINTLMLQSLKDSTNVLKTIPLSLRSSFDGFVGALGSKDSKQIENSKKQLESEIQKARESSKALPQNQLKGLDRLESILSQNNKGTELEFARSRVLANNAPKPQEQQMLVQQQSNRPNGLIGEVKVNVTGYCIKCKKDIENTTQSAGVASYTNNGG